MLTLFLSSAVFFRSPAAIPNYCIRTWQVENGLPQNKVSAVVQTRDGYLWLGTYSGLARFDGNRFTVFDDNNTPELQSSRVTSLFEGLDGTLWIGGESGEVTEYKDGRFKAVPYHAAWSGGKIYDIAADEDGDIWLLNEAGELMRMKDGKVLMPPRGMVDKVVSLARSASGKIWVAREGRLSVLEHGQLHPLEFEGAGTNNYVQGIGASQDGGLWIASDGRIRKWLNGKVVRDFANAPWSLHIVTKLMETREGVLAAGTSDFGLNLFFPDRPENPLRFDRNNQFPSNWVISLWEDREGNLWSGTGTGLVEVRPNNVETISPPDRWQGRPVLSVYAETNGALWVGTEGAGLYHFQGGVWTNFNVPQGIRNPYIWSLAEDDAGRLYVGTWGGGLFLRNAGLFDFAPGTGTLTPPMPAMLFTGELLWVGSTTGLFSYQAGKVEWFNQAGEKKPDDVRAIARDREGVIWFGTAGNGLACLQNHTIRRFTKADGLSSDFIECLHFDEDGTLWIGTYGGGLNRLKHGQFSAVARKQGLPNGIIGDIESDGSGFFWMSSFDGIIRVSETELNDCADGKINQVQCQTYGINDGLPTLECSEGLQPAGAKTADGRLLFPTAKGLVSIDPAHVTINLMPPPVVIEAIEMDDNPLDRNSASAKPFKIPPGRHRLEFQYTGLSFTAPEKVRFKYRLKGFEDVWVDAGTKRLATYNYIPPGSYLFQVAACNNDGVWNEAGASIAFDVLPFFWQTSWFRLMALAVLVAASGGLVWFDTRHRMRRKLEKAERQRDIERERTRIARDIHDDLGAYLTRITMISESTRGILDNPGRAIIGLNKIYDTARELTRSMDEIVWALNPRHDTLESLATYLEKFAQDWLAAAGIRCRLDMPVQFPEWRLTSEVRHNLFLACKEALHNVVKHSSASEVQITLTVKNTAFELGVEDNGRGFTPGDKKQSNSVTPDRLSSGNGLENMTRRLSSISGTCDIQSAPGAGTKVQFTIPIKSRAA